MDYAIQALKAGAVEFSRLAGISYAQCWRAVEAARAGDMAEADRILGTCGVEYVSDPDPSGEELAYCNLGDTYRTTLCRCDGEVFWGSWGDWLEEREAEYCQAEGVVQCGYCGEYTPLAESGEWTETVCKSCGRLVQTGEFPKDTGDGAEE